MAAIGGGAPEVGALNPNGTDKDNQKVCSPDEMGQDLPPNLAVQQVDRARDKTFTEGVQGLKDDGNAAPNLPLDFTGETQQDIILAVVYDQNSNSFSEIGSQLTGPQRPAAQGGIIVLGSTCSGSDAEKALENGDPYQVIVQSGQTLSQGPDGKGVMTQKKGRQFVAPSMSQVDENGNLLSPEQGNALKRDKDSSATLVAFTVDRPVSPEGDSRVILGVAASWDITSDPNSPKVIDKATSQPNGKMVTHINGTTMTIDEVRDPGFIQKLSTVDFGAQSLKVDNLPAAYRSKQPTFKNGEYYPGESNALGSGVTTAPYVLPTLPMDFNKNTITVASGQQYATPDSASTGLA